MDILWVVAFIGIFGFIGVLVNAFLNYTDKKDQVVRYKPFAKKAQKTRSILEKWAYKVL